MPLIPLPFVAHIEFIFVAQGPPDELIGVFYGGLPCFQWYRDKRENGEEKGSSDDTQNNYAEDIRMSLAYIRTFIRDKGPFDGVLGFSQGAQMCTLLLQLLEQSNALGGLRAAILIGGVPPSAGQGAVAEVTLSLFILYCTYSTYSIYPQRS